MQERIKCAIQFMYKWIQWKRHKRKTSTSLELFIYQDNFSAKKLVQLKMYLHNI